MKKKILLAGFFAAIMLMMPCTSAFNVPMTKDDEEELKSKIENQDEDIKESLDNLINSDGTLNIDEVEQIYEKYLLTGDPSVINSDPWEWIVNRLGWIYITLENVTTLYNSGMNLYYEIVQGVDAVQNFFESIQDFRTAWQAFKADPLNFNTITDLIGSAINLFEAAITVIEYISSDDLKEAIQTFADEVQDFVDFLNSNPWEQPIIIYGHVIGFDESLTITVKGDSTTTDDYFELTFTTVDETPSWFVHKCDIKAEYKEKEVAKSRYAFSMGKIEVDFEEPDFNAISKEYISSNSRLIQVLQRLHVFISLFFKNLEGRLTILREFSS